MKKRGKNGPAGGWRNNSARRRRPAFVAVVFATVCLLISCSTTPEEANDVRETEPVPAETNEKPLVEVDPNADFSVFKHENPQHERLPCALCHNQQGNPPTPKLSGHQPCTGCHVQQFADRQNKICTICHTDAEKGDLKRFPKLKNFTVRFEHARHRRTNCTVCHQPAGAAMTILSGFNAHAKCFQCHTPEPQGGEPNVNFCGTCHQPGRPDLSTYRAKAFGFNFTHANHRRIGCTDCHTIRAGAARGKQVTAIAAAMHFPPRGGQVSCATCHNNKRAFGGDDFADCRRCHTGGDFGF